MDLLVFVVAFHENPEVNFLNILESIQEYFGSPFDKSPIIFPK